MTRSSPGPIGSSGDVRARIEGDVMRIAIDGHFGLGLSSEVREVIKQGLDAGVPKIIIDMRRVEYIDSSGIGTLVMAWKGLMRAGGSLQLLGIPEQAKKLLKFPPFCEDGALNPEVFRD
jgi:anti-sigma B factor antagonist